MEEDILEKYLKDLVIRLHDEAREQRGMASKSRENALRLRAVADSLAFCIKQKERGKQGGLT